MTLHPARAGAVTVALGAALLLAGCTSDADGDSATGEPTAQASATEEAEDAPAAEGPVEVPDVTLLILATAEGNLVRAGLESATVDAAGAPVTVDDPATYLVTAQDPADGTVEPGSTVTLTVEPRG